MGIIYFDQTYVAIQKMYEMLVHNFDSIYSNLLVKKMFTICSPSFLKHCFINTWTKQHLKETLLETRIRVDMAMTQPYKH
jgi:23S rRNA-/tRNA-specific pseudouridylate synthase